MWHSSHNKCHSCIHVLLLLLLLLLMLLLLPLKHQCGSVKGS
jgi:hypothetical protein